MNEKKENNMYYQTNIKTSRNEDISFLQLSYGNFVSLDDYMLLKKENQQLKDNWNKLKQYLLGGVSSDNYIITQNAMLSKMQELKKRLEVGEKQYNDVVEEKEELKSLYDSTILENQKLKEKIKQIIEYAYGTDMLVSEYEQLCKIAEVE